VAVSLQMSCFISLEELDSSSSSFCVNSINNGAMINLMELSEYTFFEKQAPYNFVCTRCTLGSHKGKFTNHVDTFISLISYFGCL
jgi:hypothetical protein